MQLQLQREAVQGEQHRQHEGAANGGRTRQAEQHGGKAGPANKDGQQRRQVQAQQWRAHQARQHGGKLVRQPGVGAHLAQAGVGGALQHPVLI